jgi:NitT/TauT family transport system ATP-binding protein
MTAPRIAFENVCVDFQTERGPLRVVDDVSFAIHENEFICIVGPSGCGKTTLMNILAGFVQPTQGRVTLDGQPVQGPGRDRGVIFQEYGVFPWLTVEQNILFGLKLAGSKTPPAERDAVCRKYLALMGPFRKRSRAACASAWRLRAPMRRSRSSC